nr:hypothetical protein CFP56_37595 [Quercus suber]
MHTLYTAQGALDDHQGVMNCCGLIAYALSCKFLSSEDKSGDRSNCLLGVWYCSLRVCTAMSQILRETCC